jgi:hypothetical protein
MAAQGRYVVEQVSMDEPFWRLALQARLDEGEAHGHTLRNLLASDRHDCVLIVWERQT